MLVVLVSVGAALVAAFVLLGGEDRARENTGAERTDAPENPSTPGGDLGMGPAARPGEEPTIGGPGPSIRIEDVRWRDADVLEVLGAVEGESSPPDCAIFEGAPSGNIEESPWWSRSGPETLVVGRAFVGTFVAAPREGDDARYPGGPEDHFVECIVSDLRGGRVRDTAPVPKKPPR